MGFSRPEHIFVPRALAGAHRPRKAHTGNIWLTCVSPCISMRGVVWRGVQCHRAQVEPNTDSSSSILECLIEGPVTQKVARGAPAAASKGSKCRSERTWGTEWRLEQPLGESWGTDQKLEQPLRAPWARAAPSSVLEAPNDIGGQASA